MLHLSKNNYRLKDTPASVMDLPEIWDYWKWSTPAKKMLWKFSVPGGYWRKNPASRSVVIWHRHSWSTWRTFALNLQNWEKQGRRTLTFVMFVALQWLLTCQKTFEPINPTGHPGTKWHAQKAEKQQKWSRQAAGQCQTWATAAAEGLPDLLSERQVNERCRWTFGI